MQRSTRFELPYSFSINFKEKHGKQEKTTNLSAKVHVDIRQVDKKDAPIAFEIVLGDILRDKNKVLQYRFFEERLYRIAGNGEGSITPETIEVDLSTPNHISNFRNRISTTSDFPKKLLTKEGGSPRGLDNGVSFIRQLTDSKGRVVNENSAEMEIIAQREYHDSFLFIDGELWSTVNATEPIVSIDILGVAVVEIKNQESTQLTSHKFRLDEFQKAIEVSASIETPKIITPNTVNIMIPDAIRFDPVSDFRVQSIHFIKGFAPANRANENLIRSLNISLTSEDISSDSYTMNDLCTDIRYIRSHLENIINLTTEQVKAYDNFTMLLEHIPLMNLTDDFEDALMSVRI